MSYDATVTSAERGIVPNVRFKAYRSEPDGGLLGALDATHFAVGDVAGPANRLIAGGSGRGAEVTNRPLVQPRRVRPHALRRRPARGVGRRTLSQRPARRLREGGRRSAMRSKTSSSAMATIASRSSPTGRRGSSARGSRRSTSGRTMSRPARPIIMPGSTSRAATSSASSGIAARVDRDLRRGSRRRAQGPGRGVARAWARQAHLGRRAGGDDARRRRAADLCRGLGAALGRLGAGRGRGGAAVGRRDGASRLGDRALRRGQCRRRSRGGAGFLLPGPASRRACATPA